ncbi:MAG: N-acetyl-1-D-myo-inositol-2-amino-2-deoxy-alpha-D-glucopyranoside deacetylase [Chloroflexi bacterium]|mgnify:FL=1|nr:N-acetyl-1-D-myo-inositol-2-amino-2-deoxy-alpha-D-glucopyranoside deacetylase [Chloroflexota bacterium]OJW06489.1 MAG: N-acetyl-1-D-myo-inositol-2-amino-2-deoxy-alpha-D-glucopyranoside deacetylase [Chloroflexi bacterium 54-19]
MSDTQKEPLTFMAVHAHPDDEVFGTGGTLARLSAEGVHTVLVTSTLGENGEIVDPDLDEETKQAMFPRLGEVRIKELEGSVAALGVKELRLLGFRDSGMAGTPENDDPRSYYRATFDEAVKRLVKLVRELKPQVMATYDPFGGYGHPDHVQAHRVARTAYEVAGDARMYPDLGLEAWQPSKLYYTVISRSFFQRAAAEMRARGIEGPWNNPEMDTDVWGTADEKITTVFDVRDFVDNKIAAFRAHRTQIAPNNFMFQIPPEARRDGLGYEHFLLAQSTLPSLVPGQKEDDLFAGLR